MRHVVVVVLAGSLVSTFRRSRRCRNHLRSSIKGPRCLMIEPGARAVHTTGSPVLNLENEILNPQSFNIRKA